MKTAQTDASRIDLVMLWHMHQPDYRDHARGGEYQLPWTYLHAIKDYSDMAAHLERHPHVRCVVNFVPVLLDQIEDYASQFTESDFRDPLLRLLATEDLDQLSAAERTFLLQSCFRVNHDKMLQPFPPYARLLHLYQQVAEGSGHTLGYFSGAFYSDLITWFHLAWTGEVERRSNPLIARLMSKGEGFDHADRLALMQALGALIGSIIPRWRALAERGQIELSATPDTHPLAPLLLDLGSAREAMPDVTLPQAPVYPGGRQRMDRQIELAQHKHMARFGTPAAGMWPAEGALSAGLVKQMESHKVCWLASGEGVLRNSLAAVRHDMADCATRAWQLQSSSLRLFFRDDGLSDRIGFDYAKWHGRDAAADLVRRIEEIGLRAPAGHTPLVSIMVDGENAWETYPYNGYFFFEDFYALLRDHPRIRTTTYSDVCADPVHPPATLTSLVAGSWVYGTFSTWIGETAKNRAWDLLCAAKQSYDLVVNRGDLTPTQLETINRQLAVCESSDWFWWFNDHDVTEAVESFDALFRRNLSLLYTCLGMPVPATLATPICSTHPPAGTYSAVGAMRRSSPDTPN